MCIIEFLWKSGKFQKEEKSRIPQYSYVQICSQQHKYTAVASITIPPYSDNNNSMTITAQSIYNQPDFLYDNAHYSLLVDNNKWILVICTSIVLYQQRVIFNYYHVVLNTWMIIKKSIKEGTCSFCSFDSTNCIII